MRPDGALWQFYLFPSGFHCVLLLLACRLPSVSTAGMAKGRESGAASALFNMMRNICGSIRIAGLSTLFSVRERFHSERIGETVSLYSTATHERMEQLTTYFLSHRMDTSTAHMETLGAIGGVVRREACLQAFSDCCLLLGCVLLASTLALILMKKTAIGASDAAEH